MKKIIFVSFGILSFALGIIGIFLPLLPTTPLLLLAFYCFNNGSNRWSNWFENTAIYKKYVSEYIRRNALTRKQKLKILSLSGAMMLLSAILINNLIAIIALLTAFSIQFYIFTFRIKTYP